jgi:hypothetical protein
MEMEKAIDLSMDPNTKEWAIDSLESEKFVIETIRTHLASIDGKERPDLTILEKKENIKGEPLFVVFTNGEKEVVDGIEHEVTYLLTLAGQRYKADGTAEALVAKTFLTKNYDDGMAGSDELGDYVNKEWVNVPERVLEKESGVKENQSEAVVSQERLIMEYANLIEKRSALDQQIHSQSSHIKDLKHKVLYETMHESKESITEAEEQILPLLHELYEIDRTISKAYTQLDSENKEKYLDISNTQKLRDVKKYHTK